MTPDIKLAARHELWRRGNLTYKLDATQRKIYKAIQEGGRKFCLLCSRRLGKSFTLVLVCFEYAIKNPGSRISYAAPFARDASEIATDLAVQIMEDCPEDLRPEYRVATKEYAFSNGSTIRFAGLNAEHANQLRGRTAHLFCIDELGLVDDVRHVISDVALPMTLTTQGRLLFATTPARSPGHDSTGIIRKMQAEGQVSTFTILDNVRVPADIKAEYLIEAGENPERVPDIIAGKARPESTTALREYFCEFVTDSETAVIPEFTSTAKAEIVKQHVRPDYFFSFVALDPGFADASGCLFGYWDFLQKKLVIEDEFFVRRAGTDELADLIRQKEEALWGGRPPLLRAADVDLRLISDLASRHSLMFMPYNRTDAMGGIDLVRSMVRRREMVILPNCTGLVRQMQNATWNRSAKDFERTQEDAHSDLVSALRIMCRSVVKDRSPFPHWYGAGGFNTHGGHGAPVKKTVFSDTPLGRRLAKKWG